MIYEFTIYEFDSPFCVLYCVSLCFFQKLQPIIAQFDIALFASWHKKEKKLTIILEKGENIESINSPRCPALWFVYILRPGKEEWVLV